MTSFQRCRFISGYSLFGGLVLWSKTRGELPFHQRAFLAFWFPFSVIVRRSPMHLVLMSNAMQDEIRHGGHRLEIQLVYREMADWLRTDAERRCPGIVRETWRIQQEAHRREQDNRPAH
jgi:hypothetical protein